MSAIDTSNLAETIVQRVKPRKPLMSATVMANILYWKLTQLLLL